MNTIQEFNTLKIGAEIEIPSLAELLSFPLMLGASLQDAYEHAPSSLRKLITAIPFSNSNKLYQSINLHMQFIKPGFHPEPIDNWHFDGTDDIIHILMGPTSSTMPEYADESITMDQIYQKFDTKFIESSRFVTMTSDHIHRVGFSDVPAFRFCLEAIESDHQKPKLWKEAHLKTQWAYRNGEKVVCLEHTDQWGVIIRDRY
jgi:hypothetical protein